MLQAVLSLPLSKRRSSYERSTSPPGSLRYMPDGLISIHLFKISILYTIACGGQDFHEVPLQDGRPLLHVCRAFRVIFHIGTRGRLHLQPALGGLKSSQPANHTDSCLFESEGDLRKERVAGSRPKFQGLGLDIYPLVESS